MPPDRWEDEDPEAAEDEVRTDPNAATTRPRPEDAVAKRIGFLKESGPVLGQIKVRWLLATGGILVGALPCAPQAWADPVAPSDRPDVAHESAKALAEQGVRLFREHEYGSAREAFSRAYELDPRAETLLELGLAELEAGRPVEASKHLREYVSRSDAPEAKIDIVRTKWLPRAEGQTARLDVFVRAGAEIRVDGAVVAIPASRTPSGETIGEPLASIVIAAGEHEVSARDGTLEQSQHVAARRGELVEVHFQQVPDAPTPSATVTAAAISEEGHGITNSGAKWIAAAGLESAAIVAAGVAIGLSVAVEHSAADANALVQRVRTATGGDSGCLPPTPAAECPQVSRDRQSERTNAALANGLYVAAGAFAVVGAAAFLFWPSSKKTSTSALHPVPVLGDRAAGAGLVGAW